MDSSVYDETGRFLRPKTGILPVRKQLAAMTKHQLFSGKLIHRKNL
jgi:hypothetical protein